MARRDRVELWNPVESPSDLIINKFRLFNPRHLFYWLNGFSITDIHCMVDPVSYGRHSGPLFASCIIRI